MDVLLRSFMRASTALPRLGAGLLRGSGDAPREAMRDMLRAIQESAEGLSRMAPGESNRAALHEIQNKLQAFEHFRFAESVLSEGDGAEVAALPLTERVLRAGDLSTYARLWVVEGLGYAHAERATDIDTGAPILDPAGLSGITDGPLLPLSTGMGLALARRALLDEDSDGARPSIEDALDRFGALCARHARPGFEDAVFEAIGLIARGLVPEALPRIDAYLAKHDPARVACFWHGVGRGMFFAPTQTLPGAASLRVAVERTRREAPHEAGRLNALAGLAWATTLVHIRHPAILESFVSGYGSSLSDDEQWAFGDGVTSACVLWTLSSGYEQHLATLHKHRPGRDEPAQEAWQRLVTGPIDRVKTRWEAAARQGGPGVLFRVADRETLEG